MTADYCLTATHNALAWRGCAR